MTQLSKNNVVVNAPIYAVFGKERRELKKKRNFLRSAIKSFNYTAQLYNDMYKIYNSPERIVDTKRENRLLVEMIKDLLEIDLKLSELHK